MHDGWHLPLPLAPAPLIAVMIDVSSMGSHRWQEEQSVKTLPKPRYNVTSLVVYAEGGWSRYHILVA